jgi:hypothetical protein
MYWVRRGEDVTGGWRKLPNDEICDNFYPTPRIITLIKPSRMNGPGMWHARGSRDVCRFLVEKCEDLGVDMKMTLNWVLKQWKRREWIYLAQDRGKWPTDMKKYEPLDSIKCGNFSIN